MAITKVFRLIVIMYLVSQGMCDPVTRLSWTRPCGGERVSNRKIIRCGNFSEELSPKVNYIHKKTTQMIQFFKSEREIRYDGFDDNAFSDLPNPSDIRTGMTAQNRTENLVQDYGTISTFVIFIEQIIDDEQEHDPDVHSITVVTTWRHIRQKLLDLLCELNREIIVQIPYVTSDVMQDKVRNPANQAQRYLRDYSVLQSLKRVIEKFARKYSVLIAC